MGGECNITTRFGWRKDAEIADLYGSNEREHVWRDTSSIFFMLPTDPPYGWKNVSRITTFDTSTGKLLQDVDN
eukprot:4684744-Karenia_brevis.AAC.1